MHMRDDVMMWCCCCSCLEYEALIWGVPSCDSVMARPPGAESDDE
jgi:hypothetical protein